MGGKRQKTASNRKNITLLHVISVSYYVCTLLLQTILFVKCYYVLQQVQTLSCRSLLNNKYFFSNYQHLRVIFIAALTPTISSTHY